MHPTAFEVAPDLKSQWSSEPVCLLHIQSGASVIAFGLLVLLFFWGVSLFDGNKYAKAQPGGF